jgi:hypothetical protein
MNSDDENNVDSLLDDLFRMCHGAIIKKNQLMTDSDDADLKKCYIRYMKSYAIITQMADFVEKKNKKRK